MKMVMTLPALLAQEEDTRKGEGYPMGTVIDRNTDMGSAMGDNVFVLLIVFVSFCSLLIEGVGGIPRGGPPRVSRR